MASILNLGDSYKYSHSSQYPSNMVSMYSYMESRGGKYPATVFVGLSYYLQKYFTKPVTMKQVRKSAKQATSHGVPFDLAGWTHIVNNCDGLLPVRISAVPEGSLIPTGLPLLTIESTDSVVPWVAGFVETLLMKLWYPTNIATKSYYMKQLLLSYGSPEWAQFAFHNFGDRGSSSVESAAIGGFAHLTQFSGTDNFNSLNLCAKYYEEPTAGYSVFATEHSTTTSYGREGEEQFVYDQLLANPDAPIMSFVADSYDVYEFTLFCTAPDSRIRKLIESRPHQKLILRPDSGRPIDVITRMLAIMNSQDLSRRTVEATGITTFFDFGILWGDGINEEVIEELLDLVTRIGYDPENLVFGSGGNLMQQHDRDTNRFAIKCSSITVVDEPTLSTPNHTERDIDVYKDPITDPGKKSKRGKVTTVINQYTGKYSCALTNTPLPVGVKFAMGIVFENGAVLKLPTLAAIRERTN